VRAHSIRSDLLNSAILDIKETEAIECFKSQLKRVNKCEREYKDKLRVVTEEMSFNFLYYHHRLSEKTMKFICCNVWELEECSIGVFKSQPQCHDKISTYFSKNQLYIIAATNCGTKYGRKSHECFSTDILL